MAFRISVCSTYSQLKSPRRLPRRSWSPQLEVTSSSPELLWYFVCTFISTFNISIMDNYGTFHLGLLPTRSFPFRLQPRLSHRGHHVFTDPARATGDWSRSGHLTQLGQSDTFLDPSLPYWNWEVNWSVCGGRCGELGNMEAVSPHLLCYMGNPVCH